MGETESAKFQELFLEHLKEHHDIDSSQEFSEEEVRKHLDGEYMIPISVFSETLNKGLSPSETVVKFLRENENLSNSSAARLLGKSDANVWITYRNAKKKMKSQIKVNTLMKVNRSEFVVSTEEMRRGLSVLESVCWYLKQKGLRYKRIGILLGRDERTVWTVCQRAKKKMER